jgi:hypothetical protein
MVAAAPEKKKTKRRRLSESIRKFTDPILREYGFENPPVGHPYDWGVSRRNVWIRIRGDYRDEIYFTWDKYGRALIALSFLTSQVERMRPPDVTGPTPRLNDGNVLPNKWLIHLFVPGFDFSWFGYFSSVESTVRLAKMRLADLNSYLLTGLPKDHIDVESNRRGRPSPDDDPTVSIPVFWHQALPPEGTPGPD